MAAKHFAIVFSKNLYSLLGTTIETQGIYPEFFVTLFEDWCLYGVLRADPNTTPEQLACAEAHMDQWPNTLIPVYDLEGNVSREYLRYVTQGNG